MTASWVRDSRARGRRSAAARALLVASLLGGLLWGGAAAVAEDVPAVSRPSETSSGAASDRLLARPEAATLRLPLQLDALGRVDADAYAERQLLDLVNRERQSAGLTLLWADEELRDVARRYSLELLESGQFGHHSARSGTLGDRLRRGGIRFRIGGENLALGPNVTLAHAGLMNSASHRANILRSDYRRVGVGVIDSELRGKLFTQCFAD